MAETLSIGQRLSKARHDLDKKRSTVAEDLNIRESYIEAIESDDYSKLPGKAYVSGFIKSYSEYLELDVDDILKMLRATQDLQEDYQNMPQQLYKDYKRTRHICMFSFVIVLILVIGINYYNYVQHEINIRKIEKKDSASQTLTSFYNQTQKKEDLKIIENSSQEITSKLTKVKEKAKEESKYNEENIELYKQKSKPPFAEVLLKATDDVWIQIRLLDRKDMVFVSHTIPKGKYYWVTRQDNAVMDISDPSKLEVIIDKKNLGPMGPSNKKVRGIFLDSEYLKTYYDHQENKNSSPIKNYYKKES